MSPVVMFVIVTIVPVVIGAVTLGWFLERREKRRQQQEDIREAARKDRATERRRVARVKRITRQDEIGDRIFWSLYKAWKMANSPDDRMVLRIRHNGDSYYIQIGRENSIVDPIGAKVWINVNLSQPGKEITITGDHRLVGREEGYLMLPLGDGEGFIHNILAARIYGA